MRFKTNLLILFLFSLCLNLTAQENSYLLKGVVKEANGEPIIGASVSVQDGKTGTVTDLDGKFSLKVPKNATIGISYIGYKKRQIVLKPNENNLNIVLEISARDLDEIVVVGYGVQRKSSLTSSIETIKNEDLLKIPAMNLDEALTGQVAGMHVKNSISDPSSAREADIRIRGIAGAPLLVIDGVPRFATSSGEGEMRLSDINPDDVESISILKDAAASAVYGARAANGVILVKTKRGAGNSKTRVNYRGQFNLQQAAKLPNFLDSYQFALLNNLAVDRSGDKGVNKYYSAEELELIRTGSDPDKYANENLMDYLDKYGYSTTHNISLSGGNNFLKYYVSGGYTSIKGLYSGVGRDRYNYAVKLDATLTKGLTFAVDVLGTRSENKNTSYSTIDAAYSYSPVQTLRFQNGLMTSIGGSNPLISVDGLGGYIRNKMNFNTISGTLTYELPWVKGLSTYLKATIDDNSSQKKTYSNPVTLYKKDLVIDDDGEEKWLYNEDTNTVYPKAKVSLEEYEQTISNKLFEFGANYQRTFAQLHNVSALFVFNYQDYKFRYITAENQNLPGTYPELIGSADGKVKGTEYYKQRMSIVGRVTYNFDSRYFVEGSFRSDASTKFHPDYRWGIFPTISGSWIASNESFFKNWNQNVISNVKLRASVGLLGDDAELNDYAYLMNYMYAPREGYPIGEGITSLRPGVVIDINSYPNKELELGKSLDYNFAIDLGLWDNRFSVSYEYYQRYRTNMIKTVPTYLFPPSVGAGGAYPNMNFGRLKAWGWDLSVNYKNTIKKFKYDVTLGLSKTDDVYEDYGDESSVSPNRRRKGHSSSVWFLYEADGLFANQEEIDLLPYIQDNNNNSTLAPGDIRYKDTNKDGVLDKSDMIAVKNSSYPDISFNLKLNLQYAGFFMNAMFQGAGGYNQMINELYTLENNSMPRFQDYHLTDAWSETNLNATYPRVKIASSNDNNRKESTFWIRNSRFVRLKSLSLGYSLPKSILKKAKLSSLSIALQGGNLFTWSSLKDIDPESLRGYPIQRSYGATLNFGF